jgi:membrane-associated protease RseP (regulator of RpoE activity)
MDFIVYDIIFLILFALFLVLFLYQRKQHLKRQGLLYLYHTKVGLKIIDYTATRYKKILKPMQYVVIASGYILMAAMIYLLYKFTIMYLASPVAAQTLKIPVLTPLIPYLPALFKIDFLPPFYFAYWIIIIAIIAIPHEFAHGIFAKLNKIKVHSTGFGFLGPFLAAFVEPDEKQMEKSKKVPQLAILASGTFANVLTTILFGLILWGFFSLAFIPAGVNLLNVYPVSAVNTSDLTEINGMPLSIYNLDNSTLTEIKYQNETRFIDTGMLKLTLIKNSTSTFIYDKSPAFESRIAGEPSLLNLNVGPAITEINGIKTPSIEKLNSTLHTFSPGDTINITILSNNEKNIKSVTLADINGKAYLGIIVMPSQPERKSALSIFYAVLSKVKSSSIHYESRIGDLGMFIYNLLWWIVIVCIGVALTNMIPVGIFDGGRFFFLTVWGITGSKKVGEIAFKISTWLILLVVLALMVQWFVAVF